MTTTTAPTVVRAGIYLRISLDRRMDGLAIERQRADCEKIVSDRGWTLVDTYVDQSISASKRNVVRPEYNRMVADFDAGLLDAIVCWDLDRLTRQPRQLEDWIDRATEHGLKLVTATGEADLTTDSGRLFAGIKAQVARNEIERKSARQSAAQQQRAEQGRPPKGIRPMGYALDGSVIEAEADVMRRIFEAVDKDTTFRDIARALNGDEAVEKRGVLVPLPDIPKTPRHSHTLDVERNARRRENGEPEKPVRDPYPWIPTTLLSMLRNPRYAGYSVYRDRTAAGQNKWRGWRDNIVRDEHGEPVMGQWTPIIDADLWWRVQQRLDKPDRKTNHTGKTVRSHLGAGMYLCPECGKTLVTHGQSYRCAGHVMRTSSHVDEAVREVIIARLSRADAQGLLPAKNNPEVTRLDEEVTTRKGRIRRAEDDYANEIIEGRDLKRIRDAERGEIEKLEARRARLTAGDRASGVFAAEDPAAVFAEADIATQRTVIDALCSVTLLPHPRGKRGFDPKSVVIDWKS